MPEESNSAQIPPETNMADSDKICEVLIALLKTARINPPVPIDDVREFINQWSQKLSFHEKAKLFINFLTFPGTLLYDPGGLFEANIRIDDKHSGESENRPLAYIEFSDGYNSRVEVIDILESVRNDATLIGHPVIIYAIHHWQQILIWERYNKSDDIYSDDEFNKWVDALHSGKYIESARQNLEAIGKAIFESVRRQAISKETALTLKIKDLKLEEKNNYLSIAWDRLHSKHIKQTHGLDERIDTIESYLRQLPSFNVFKRWYDYPEEFQQYGYVDTTIRISTVIDFLRSEGSKFVFEENNHNSLRPRWAVFKNAFIKWFFRKEGTTIEKYQQLAKKQKYDEKPYFTGTIRPSSRPANLYRFLHHVLTTPLHKYCEPIECSKDEANSHTFADLINQTKTK